MLGSPSRYRVYGGLKTYLISALEFATGAWTRDRAARADGGDVARLEALLKKELVTGDAVAVPMARVGIYLAIKNLIYPGQSVLMSPYTIADVVNMVIAAGGVPRFVDVDPVSGNMSPRELRNRITPNCGAVLVTHLHGLTAEIEEIAGIARAADLPLIEDTAQALGARAGERRTGAIGDVGVFSFGTYKNVNAWYGGAIICRDPELAREIRAELATWPFFSPAKLYEKFSKAVSIAILCWDPIFRTFTHRLFRYGFLHDVAKINRAVAIELDTRRHDALPAWYRARMTPGQARRVLEQWPAIENHTRERVEYARAYDRLIPESAGVRKPPAPDGRRHVYTYYPLLARDRVNLLKWLMYFRRDVAAQHLKNCAHLESFRHFHHDCPAAAEVARSVVLLPTYAGYGLDEVKKNASIVRWYVEQGEPAFSFARARAETPPWRELLPAHVR